MQKVARKPPNIYVIYECPPPSLLMRGKKKSLGGNTYLAKHAFVDGDGEKAYSRIDNVPFRTSLHFLFLFLVSAMMVQEFYSVTDEIDICIQMVQTPWMLPQKHG